MSVFRNLQLDDSEWQPVNKDDDVRSAIVLAFDDSELVHSQPAVRLWIVEVDQPDVITRDGSIVAAIFDWHAISQHLMKRAVVADERRRVVSENFAQCFFARVARNYGVQPRDGAAQPLDEHDISK